MISIHWLGLYILEGLMFCAGMLISNVIWTIKEVKEDGR